MRSELHRVSDQIQQHLAQAKTIAQDGTGQQFVDIDAQRYGPMPHLRLKLPHAVLHARPQVERGGIHFQSSRLDL